MYKTHAYVHERAHTSFEVLGWKYDGNVYICAVRTCLDP